MGEHNGQQLNSELKTCFETIYYRDSMDKGFRKNCANEREVGARASGSEPSRSE